MPDQCLISGPKQFRDKTNCRINSWFFSLVVFIAFISRRRNRVSCFTFPRPLVYIRAVDLYLFCSTSPSPQNPAHKLEQDCLRTARLAKTDQGPTSSTVGRYATRSPRRGSWRYLRKKLWIGTISKTRSTWQLTLIATSRKCTGIRMSSGVGIIT